MVHLGDLLAELSHVGIGIVGVWEINRRRGITLGNPAKSFPNPTGPQIPIDLTARGNDPHLTDEEADAIRRRFGIGQA